MTREKTRSAPAESRNDLERNSRHRHPNDRCRSRRQNPVGPPHHPNGAAPLDLDDALQRILDEVPAPAACERVDVERALGRVAAADCLAATDLPPFPASAMDGYAFRWRSDLGGLRIVGASLAGHPFQGAVGAAEAVYITTGAALPADCDTVAMQEDCAVAQGVVRIESPVRRADNVRQKAQDLRRGAVLAERGRRLSPFDIGTLAAAGVAAASVFAPPRIAVFSSGDELQQPGTTLAHGNIYDSNRYAVASLLAQLPVETVNLGVLPDDEAAIAEALRQASGDCRMILTSGGVSVGEADLVKSAIESLGSLSFWRLHLKPGKPLAFGRIGDALLLGLPGNPVSSIVTYLLLARPAIEALCGMQPQPPLQVRCELTEPVRHKPGREEYQRGILSTEDGQARVRTTGNQSSNRMSALAAANCLIRIPKAAANLAPGSAVDVLPFWGLV